MKLKVHIRSVVRRAKAFYHSGDPGHFLINTNIPADRGRLQLKGEL